MKKLHTPSHHRSVDLHSITGIKSGQYVISDQTVDLLQEVIGRMEEKLDLKAEPDASGLYSGYKEFVRNVADSDILFGYTQEDLEIVLGEIIIMPPLRDKRVNRVAYQALMVIVLDKYISGEMTPRGMYLVLSLLSFSQLTHYSDTIEVGAPTKIGKTKMYGRKANIGYKMRDMINACLPELNLSEGEERDYNKIIELLPSDPYFIFLLPEQMLNPDDPVIFKAFERVIAFIWLFFGQAWEQWLCQPKFQPLWSKILRSNAGLMGKMRKYPKWPERLYLNNFLGEDVVNQILVESAVIHNTVEEITKKVHHQIEQRHQRIPIEERFRRGKNGHKTSNNGHQKPNSDQQEGGSSEAPKRNDNEIAMPDPKTIFVSGGEGKQLAHIFFPKDHFPLGTKVCLERGVRGNGKHSFSVAHQEDTTIPPIEPPPYGKHLSYTLTIQLPRPRTFSGGQSKRTLVHNIYIPDPRNVEVIPLEQRATARQVAITIQSSVSEVLDEPIIETTKTLKDTLETWELALSEDGTFSSDLVDDESVLFRLSPDLADLVHDGSFSTIVITHDGSMNHHLTPEIDIQLQKLARDIREQKAKEIQRVKDETERSEIMEELRPIYDILEGDLFGVTEKTLEPTELNDALRLHGALIILNSDRSAMWLKLPNAMQIKYYPGGSINILTKGENLSPIRKECYTELGEAMDRIGRILCEKNEKTRKTRITEMKSRRDHVDALFTRMQEGRAFAIMTNDSSYLSGGEFPRNIISGMVRKFHGQAPQPEGERSIHIILCADSVNFKKNGAGNSLNGLEYSLWGRQILWERICRTRRNIPLGEALIYTQEERGEITGRAGEILLGVEWRGDKEQFLDEYIGLLKTHEIHVYYGPFVTMKWSEYVRERNRRQPKQSEEGQETTTAD